ncbi:TSUP family transporter [Conexibacter sp. JD483]|uniref:TSUP family transporter n=1 Tax=unclassified Conexibacter TaxID=2627773 RepID=UPI00272034B9|nr:MULTISPECIES: TSUP family transporter [unclassified Conexibacter]MDO8188467.1 TSUP family transporter [Conexibacter sp. CPCC 205706]MDO8201457.1 TSUP family transporter [Conexibacter sp. CPCC 205762]MDR9371763.1 TSUP family transporter [Conexibacter sp. JD483]
MSIEIALALAAFGLAVGAAAGLLGVGGGILMVPFLTLAIGIEQHAAQATSLLVVLPTAIVATITLQRRGVGDLSGALQLGALGALGSVGGGLLALALPASALRICFAVFLGGIGIRLARSGWKAMHVEAHG